ncbi:MAG: hypothetical protein VX498_13775 [Myxococcota bacterium]|nr:hypothetical protein [Myxococcota bacterium]
MICFVRNWLWVLVLPALALGCGDVTIHQAPPSEGDDPGECTDDVDNDNDGLFDCDDPGCSGSEACAQNLPPTRPSVTIDPPSPQTVDTLRCYVSEASNDPEGSPVDYLYTWTLDGEVVPEIEEAEVTDDRTERGQNWNCSVAATDGELTGPAGSATVTVVNAPPSAPLVSILPGTPNPQDDLVCSITSLSTDADGDEVTYTYEWVSDGVPAGHTEDVLNWYSTEASQDWACLVTPFDGFDEGAQGEDLVSVTPDVWPHVAVGEWHSCSVQADSSSACWGDDSSGQASLPPMGSWSELTTGVAHTCGMSFPDMSVTCWGDTSYDQDLAPTTTFMQIDAGSWHSCGVSWNGIVVCWGSADNWSDFMPPAGIAWQVTGGEEFSCALMEDGSIGCWGAVPFTPPPGPDYLEVDAGSSHLCALNDSFEISCWGHDAEGQVSGASQWPGTAFSTVSAGHAHSCAVEQGSGAVRCWGRDSEGQVSGVPNGQFVDVAAGWNHSCGIRPSGAVVCWGCLGDDRGQCSP